MAIVTFHPGGVRIDVPEGTSLLEAAQEAGTTSVACCGITPACGRCRTTVIDGDAHLTPASAFEVQRRGQLAFLPGERIGCMAHVYGDVEVEVAR